MAFTGKYELESQENYEEFLGAIGKLFFVSHWHKAINGFMWLVMRLNFVEFGVAGLLQAKTDDKVITDLVQDGNNFTWKQSIPGKTWSNAFSVGQECELATMTGAKFKVS